MPDKLRVERQGGPTLEAGVGVSVDKVYIDNADHGRLTIDAGDLLWLVTTGGPAMIALLGGPLAIKGGAAPSEAGRHG